MGKLVHFDKRGRVTRVRPGSGGPAQIYLFTGIRYERDGTPIPNKPGGPVRIRRKRV